MTRLSRLPDVKSIDLYREQAIQIVVVTGFLGVGKTTFINQYLAENKASDIAIIVNEFGEIGIDHLVVESLSEDVVLMESGCLCCAAMGNVEEALFSLLEKRERAELPRYSKVVIETSGLANPGPIIEALMSDAVKLSPYVYQGTLTLVDAETFISSNDEHQETGLQVIYGDRVLINRAKMVSKNTLSSINKQLRELGGIDTPVEILDETRSASVKGYIDTISPALCFDKQDHFRHEKKHIGQVFSISRKANRAISATLIVDLIRDLVARFAEDILRLKLLLPNPEGQGGILIQAVKGRWFPQQSLDLVGDMQVALVVIAKDTHKRELVALIRDSFG